MLLQSGTKRRFGEDRSRLTRGEQDELLIRRILADLRLRCAAIRIESIEILARFGSVAPAILMHGRRTVGARVLLMIHIHAHVHSSAHGHVHCHRARLPKHTEPHDGQRRPEPGNPDFLPVTDGGEDIHERV